MTSWAGKTLKSFGRGASEVKGSVRGARENVVAWDDATEFGRAGTGMCFARIVTPEGKASAAVILAEAFHGFLPRPLGSIIHKAEPQPTNPSGRTTGRAGAPCPRGSFHGDPTPRILRA